MCKKTENLLSKKLIKNLTNNVINVIIHNVVSRALASSVIDYGEIRNSSVIICRVYRYLVKLLFVANKYNNYYELCKLC